ncbi:MAG: heat-inducible transcriptional repressor HrcA [Armatimonadota bacterium]|nr:heat-inducible transcriptional repressor HrcA [Armatimonadota bacterium]MDR7466854.1 heat-inducible transcriptional repressor HrcA [Armatimonadota bacterium]MDR7552762.1 heat-inducible transcriptional repressor HrcA [Armatimonadota bacterium]MDR7557802.1 heat-inducible transcriptional repressor HrcA [Armatimonadota bacterium]
MQLDARKREILRAVVQTYVSEAEPVGSERVAHRLRERLSPATVRNEMAALEELGVLTHPHTSAGRIPTDLGYRLYVEMLREDAPPSAQERTRLRRLLADREEREGFPGGVARALAAVTEHAALVSAPAPEHQRFKHLHFLPLGATEVMAVIVTDAGTIQGRTFDVREALEPEALDRLSRVISQRLQGYELHEITGGLLARMVDEAAWQQRILEQLLAWMRAVGPAAPRRVYIEGTANILRQPEFRDARAAEPVLAALEDDAVVADLLRSAPDRDVWVIIGREHRREELRGTSVIAAAYRVHGRAVGTLGIVGPTRMHYGRIISLVRYLAESVGELLTAPS